MARLILKQSANMTEMNQRPLNYRLLSWNRHKQNLTGLNTFESVTAFNLEQWCNGTTQEKTMQINNIKKYKKQLKTTTAQLQAPNLGQAYIECGEDNHVCWRQTLSITLSVMEQR